MRTKQKQDKGLCRLDLSPGSGEKCYPGECRKCGWNASVEFRRKEQIRKNGLTKDKHGRRRLIIGKEIGNGQKPTGG